METSIQPGARCPGCDAILVHSQSLKKAPHDEVLGSVIGRKYAVVGILGSGGFGTVYRAVQEPVGREVALKLVHAHHSRDPDVRARFFREARVVANLSDPTVVTLFDYGDEPELGLYCVFELVEGKVLNAYLKKGPQDPLWVAHVLVQLLGALGEAHAKGLVHRDIKPANVMVVQRGDGEYRVRLLDFGIAKVLPEGDMGESFQTKQGMVVGTPEYMSPEQARARSELDARSDLYSLGVLAYSLIAGGNPFARDSAIDTLLAHCSTPPEPFDPSLKVPPALETAILKALEKKPADRFQSAGEMCRALTAAFPLMSLASGLGSSTFASVGGSSASDALSGASAAALGEPSSGLRSGAGPNSTPAAPAPASSVAVEPASAEAHLNPPSTAEQSRMISSSTPTRGGGVRWAAVAVVLLLGAGGLGIYFSQDSGDRVVSLPIETEKLPARETDEGDGTMEAETDPAAPTGEAAAEASGAAAAKAEASQSEPPSAEAKAEAEAAAGGTEPTPSDTIGTPPSRAPAPRRTRPTGRARRSEPNAPHPAASTARPAPKPAVREAKTERLTVPEF